MSTARAALVVLLCMFLAGCAPITGTKSIIAGIAAVVSLVVALWGFSGERQDQRVERKSLELDEMVTAHQNKYHKDDENRRA